MKPARWLLPVISALAGLALWAALKHGLGVPSFQLPSPTEVWAAACRERAFLAEAAATTLLAACAGFVAACTAGAAVAAVLASSTRARLALHPHVLFLQMTPVVVLAPVLVLWLGAGFPSVATIAFLISFFPVVANTTQGLLSVDRTLVDLFKMLGAGRRQEILHLRLPAALPHFLTGMRIAASLAMIGAITGEFFAGFAEGGSPARGGLGFLVIAYSSQVKIPALFATGLTACLCGFLFVGAVSALNWLLLHRWHDSIPRRDA